MSLSEKDKPLPTPGPATANQVSAKQMLYTPFSFRRDRQKQIESTVFFQPSGFASANTSVTNLTIPYGHQPRRQSILPPGSGWNNPSSGLTSGYTSRRTSAYGGFGNNGGGNGGAASSRQSGAFSYRDSVYMAPPVPSLPSPYAREALYAAALNNNGNNPPTTPPKSTVGATSYVNDSHVILSGGSSSINGGSEGIGIGRGSGGEEMAQYDRQTFNNLRDQVLSRNALQGYPIDCGAHSWVFDNGMKCREDVRERNGSVLWGGKWAGEETCVNVYDWDATEGPVFHHALDDVGLNHLQQSTRSPSVRIYFIAETALHDQMSASLSTLQKLFTAHNVPPAYMEIALMTTSGSCGQRVLYDNRKGRKKKVTGYDIWYELRHSFTTSETHRQLVNLHYDPIRRSIVVFFIGSQIREAQQRVHQIFSTSKPPFDGLKKYYESGTEHSSEDHRNVSDSREDGSSGSISGEKDVEGLLEDPFSLVAVFLNLTFDDLFQIQAEFDMQVWRLTSDSFSLSNARPTLTAVHQLASNSLRHATQLSRLFQTSILVRSHHHNFLDKITKSNNGSSNNRNSLISGPGGLDWMIGREVSMGPVSERVSDEIAVLVERSRDLKGWAVEREGIIKNDINLRYNIITQRDSRITASIAKDARRDSGSMKAIAILTMVFLPGTFVSALMQLKFVEEALEGNGWGVYSAVTFPLTVVTLVVWYIWQHRDKVEHRRSYEDEEGCMGGGGGGGIGGKNRGKGGAQESDEDEDYRRKMEGFV